MKFTFVTIFKELIKPYFSASILGNAVEKSLISIDFINPRDFTNSKHLKVDDTPYSGGAGMLMSAQPLFDALDSITNDKYIIFVTPSAKQFNNKDALRLSKKRHLVFVSGRYEGIDERVIEQYADEVLSIGDYVLTGGELPSLVLCDAISRHVKDVLGNKISLEEESFEDEKLEAPAFTKPKKYNGLSVNSEYLKGNHSKIAILKNAMSLEKTRYFRPDLYKKVKIKKGR